MSAGTHFLFSIDPRMASALQTTDSSLEAELERAEQLQKSDAHKAEEGFRAILARKAGKCLW